MHRRALFGLLAIGWLLSPPCAAQAPEPGVAALHGAPIALDSWGIRDGRGLPQLSVSAIARSPRGYLWLGTQRGLARFDGVRFVTFRPGPPAPAFTPFVTALLAAPDTTLWVGTRFDGLVHLDIGSARTRVVETGLPSDRISALYLDAAGRLWVGSDGGGVAYREGSRFAAPAGTDRLSGRVIGFAERGGAVLVATSTGVSVLGVEGPETLLRFDGANNAVHSLAIDGGGRVFVGTSNGLWTVEEAGQARLQALEGQMVEQLVTRGDTVLAASPSRIYRVDPDGPVRTLTPRPLRARIAALYADDEGSLWIGTATSGLFRIRPTLFHVIGPPEGLAAEVATAVLQDRSGAVWIGTDGGGVQRFGATETDTFSLATGHLPSDVVLALHEDSDGAIWVGTNAGASRLADPLADPEVALRVPGDAPLGPLVRTIAEDGRGRTWLGGRGGLQRWDGGPGRRYTSGDGLPEDYVLTLEPDGGGGLWIGTSGGLARLAGDSILSIADPAGPGAAAIWDIHGGRDGVLWLATGGNGLVRYDGARFRSLGTAEGLCADELLGLAEDGRGRLWMSSYRGLFWIRPEEADAVLSGRADRVPCREHGQESGMRSREATGGVNPSAIRSRDGRLWFPTTRGAVVVDPERLSLGLGPPRVVVEEVRIDGVTVATDGEVTVPADAMRLEIRFTGISFIGSERIRFRYAMEGLDPEWLEAEDARLASYTSLPPGRYRFRVRAANTEGEWSPEGAGFGVVVEAHFWETTWFRIILVLLALALLGGVYAARIRSLRRRQAERIRRITERERTERRALEARLRALRLELHPHFVFNTLNGISGLIRQGDRDRALDVLTRFAALTRATLRGREVVTRPLREEIDYIEEYLSLERIRFGDGLDVSIDVTAAAAAVEVPPLILQPLVENALRHGVRRTSEAGRLEIRARVEGGELVVRVADNGPGIPGPDELRYGTGLSNVEERLAELYGERGRLMVIPSTEGGLVEIRIPAMGFSAPASAARP